MLKIIQSIGAQFLTVLLIVSCSSVDVPGGGNGNGDGGDASFAAQVTGDWSGQFINKTVDAASNLHRSSINASFAFKDETGGTFSLSIPDAEKAMAEGTFVDFAGKALHLKITKSTISTIGSTGSSTSLNYNLVGTSMELTNERVELQLIKSSGEPAAPTDGSPDPNDPNGTLGRYTCTDNFNNTWKVNVKSETAISIDIFSKSGTATDIWIDGSLALETKNSIVVGSSQISASNIKDYVGMRLNLKFPVARQLEVERLATTGEKVEDAFLCAKI